MFLQEISQTEAPNLGFVACSREMLGFIAVPRTEIKCVSLDGGRAFLIHVGTLIFDIVIVNFYYGHRVT